MKETEKKEKDWTPAESVNKQVVYYNARSSSYSKERYPHIVTNYQQYIFKTRLFIFLNFLEEIINNLPEKPSILEIGCADGILLKQIERKFPGVFSRFVGVDVAPKMIEEAKKQNISSKTIFLLRDNLAPEKFDVVVELGVYPFDMGEEMSFVSSHLKEGGYFFYSVSGLKSFYTNIKNKNAYHIKFHKTYQKYNTFFSTIFSIKKSRVYALFIPKLWSVPIIARILQPIFDRVFRKVTPEFFHEKIYLLQKIG